MAPITGTQIKKDFYTQQGCVLEDVIENYFYQYYKTINPLIIGRKESIGGKPTDGIIRFYDNKMNLKFWILQETKRDIGIKSVFINRSLLQSLMYLGNIYYDVSYLGVDTFNGIFLNSARYFIYIPKNEIDSIMEDFEPLWKKYFRISPSKAYKEQELNKFINSRIYNSYSYNLDDSFRLDLLIEKIYYNNI